MTAVTSSVITFSAGPSFRHLDGLLIPTAYVRNSETGRLVVPAPIPFRLDRNGDGAVVAPHTDLSFYTDEFTYTVSWAVTAGAPAPGYKEFPLPSTTAATVTFDSLPSSPPHTSGGGTSGGGLTKMNVVTVPAPVDIGNTPVPVVVNWNLPWDGDGNVWVQVCTPAIPDIIIAQVTAWASYSKTSGTASVGATGAVIPAGTELTFWAFEPSTYPAGRF